MKVKVGKYDLRIPSETMRIGAEHWAVCVGNTWYEVAGKMQGSKQTISKHQNDDLYQEITIIGETSATEEDIEKWIQKWLHDHPYYEVNDSNCQLFTKHFIFEFTGVNLDTQNRKVGDTAIGIGIGAMIAGAVAIILGAFVKGKH